MVARNPELPFQPIRNTVYSSTELLSGFDRADPQSMGRTVDFKSYVFFVINGRASLADPYAGMMESLHDGSIVRSMYNLISNLKRPTAAIMGGHREPRGSATYVNVARISKKLSEAGFLMASGGGPGAMEATHLGALLRGCSDAEFVAAVDSLKSEPTLPATAEIVDPEGKIRTDLVAQLHKWALPAIDLFGRYPNGGESLAVPTWHYGHEPISPLATHVAKYFLNSIREDVLLALATNGIIFAPGRAGTLQEVFQDAAQNYYATKDQPFAPMIFFDTKFWRGTSCDGLPVEPLLEALFVKNGKEAEYRSKVLFTDDIDELVGFLITNRPSPGEYFKRMMALGLGPMLAKA